MAIYEFDGQQDATAYIDGIRTDAADESDDLTDTRQTDEELVPSLDGPAADEFYYSSAGWNVLDNWGDTDTIPPMEEWHGYRALQLAFRIDRFVVDVSTEVELPLVYLDAISEFSVSFGDTAPDGPLLAAANAIASNSDILTTPGTEVASQ